MSLLIMYLLSSSESSTNVLVLDLDIYIDASNPQANKSLYSI